MPEVDLSLVIGNERVADSGGFIIDRAAGPSYPFIPLASEGRIVEYNTHSERLAPSGRYADSPAAQMEASR